MGVDPMKADRADLDTLLSTYDGDMLSGSFAYASAVAYAIIALREEIARVEASLAADLMHLREVVRESTEAVREEARRAVARYAEAKDSKAGSGDARLTVDDVDRLLRSVRGES